MYAANRRRSTGYRAHCRAYRNLATVQKGRKKHKIRTLAHTHTHTHSRDVYPTHTQYSSAKYSSEPHQLYTTELRRHWLVILGIKQTRARLDTDTDPKS